MIALDSSAVLRYLTNDKPKLAQQVERLIDGNEPIAISSLVLLEVVHVLRSSHYRRRNPDIADTLVELLTHQNVRVPDLDANLACAAIIGVRSRSPRHLADALIAASAKQAGATRLITNDSRFTSELIAVSQL